MSQSSGSSPSIGRSSAPRRDGYAGSDPPEPELDESRPEYSDDGSSSSDPGWEPDDPSDPGPEEPPTELEIQTVPSRPRGRPSSSSSSRTGVTASRIPPHDLSAERAVLGAMLLSAEARDVAAARLDAADFYAPRNGHVYQALEKLWLDGRPVDPVTVSDELSSLRLLDDVGGPSAVVSLMVDTPSTSNVLAYVEIVERTSRQRKLIAWTNELGELAYRGTDWHEQLGRVLELGNKNGVVHSPSTIEFVDLGPILAGDVKAELPFWLVRDDGKALLYPGRVHDLHAPPSVGKTWIALLAMKGCLEAGGSGLILDYEDTAHNTISRLLSLGVDPELLTDPTRFRYSNPAGAHGLAEKAHLEKVLGELEPDLAILDGVAAALARSGYDENSNTEVSLWSESLVKPIARSGAAVLLLDHVTKQTENRARGARGAGAKLAMIDGASYEVKLSRAYSRTRPGLVRLIIAKDRVGFVGGIGEVAADIHVRPSDGGARLELSLEAPSTDEPHKLTGLMESLSKRLEGAGGPLTRTSLFAGYGTEKRHLDKALADLLADGHARPVTTGKGSTETFAIVLPYREPADEPTDDRGADRPPEPDEDTEPAGSGSQATEEPMF